MNEWATIQIGSCVKTNIRSIGKNDHYSEIKYLDTGSITCNRINGYQLFPLTEAPSRAKRIVQHEDIIYSSVRPNQRHYGFIINPPEELIVSTGFVVVTCNQEKIIPKFLYYYLTQDSTTDYLHSIAEASTSAYPSLKPSDIEALEIDLPSLTEQKAIAFLLSSLDDKIDLLYRQNKTLEAMAETLFRQWFIEEADDSWKEVLLQQYIDIDTGFAFKSELYQEDGTLKVIRGKNVTIGNVRWGDDSRYWNHSTEGLEKYLLDQRDIVIGMDGSLVGKNRSLVHEKDLPAILAQRVARIKAKNIDFQPFVWQHVYSSAFQNYIEAINTGTSIPHISLKQIKDFEILQPPINKIEKFSSIVTSLWDKQEKNTSLIVNLEKLRNTLIPKLISGEVKVEI